jgi:hypothetical protein
MAAPSCGTDIRAPNSRRPLTRCGVGLERLTDNVTCKQINKLLCLRSRGQSRDAQGQSRFNTHRLRTTRSNKRPLQAVQMRLHGRVLTDCRHGATCNRKHRHIRLPIRKGNSCKQQTYSVGDSRYNCSVGPGATVRGEPRHRNAEPVGRTARPPNGTTVRSLTSQESRGHRTYTNIHSTRGIRTQDIGARGGRGGQRKVMS